MRRSGSTGRFDRRLRRADGQSVIVVGIVLLLLIALIGVVIDVGRVYIAQRDLQRATDAAALAAAQDLPNGQQAEYCAQLYSAQGPLTTPSNACNTGPTAASAFNSSSSLSNVTTDSTLKCYSPQVAGISCALGPANSLCTTADQQYDPYGSSNNQFGCNAIQVHETATVDPLFMQVFGFGGQTVSARSTATIAGGLARPLNVEVLLDRTPSMSSVCTSPVDGVPNLPTNNPPAPTKLDCAKAGMRALLSTLQPCSLSIATCGSDVSGTTDVAGPVDRVGLMGFPPENSSSLPANSSTTPPIGVVPQETDCTQNVSGSQLDLGKTTGNYQQVPLSSDYKVSDSATALNQNSPLVQSVWWKACPGGVYPYNGGGGNSSIQGDLANDHNTATNATAISGGPASTSSRSNASNGDAIGGGVGTPGGSASASNGTGPAGGPGLAGNQSTATTGLGLSGGPGNGTSNTNGSPVGGGPNSGSANDVSTASTNGAKTLQVARPGTGTTRAVGDFLLVTVTAQAAALNANSNICPTTNPASWTLIDQHVSTNAASSPVIEASFWTVRPTAAAENYTFNFFAGACTAGAPTGDVTVAASAIATRYTNVPTTGNPIDISGANIGGPSTQTFNGSAPSTSWVRTPAPFFIGFGAAACSNTGVNNCATAVTAPGVIATANLTFPTAVANGTTYTITLYINGASTGDTCTITGGQTTCLTAIAANDTVAAGDTIALRVRPSNGGTVKTSTATATATETTGAGLLAPTVTTTAPGDTIVRIFGTGATSLTGNGLPVTAASSGTATGMTDAQQAAAGATGTASANGNTADDWVAQTIAIKGVDQSSITVTRPTPGTFLLVTVTADFSGWICAPTGGGWTVATQTNGTTAVSQATFTSTTTNPGPYKFTFSTNVGCSAPTSAPASYAAVAYTGVTGVDTTATGTNTGTNRNPGNDPLAPRVTTTVANEQLVEIWGTESTFQAGQVELTSTGGAMATGLSDSAAGAAGANKGGDDASTAASGSWVGQTIGLTTTQTSLSLPAPANYAAGDLLLVSVTAKGLGTTGSVCAPGTGIWTPLTPVTQGTGVTSVTQATFWSYTAPAGPYVFTFSTGACGGTTTAASASAVGVRYTGVSKAPIDIAGTNQGLGTALTAPAETTTLSNDLVVRFFGTTDSTLTYAGSGTGFFAVTAPTTTQTGAASTGGTSNSIDRATSGNSANWVGQTVALIDGRSSLVINRPATQAAGDFLLATVTATGLNGNVCAPADNTWTRITQTTQGSGSSSVTQATFRSFRTGTPASDPGPYTFTFRSGSCPTGGTALSVSASGVIVRYTNVDTANPVDALQSTTAGTNPGTSVAPPQVTTRVANDRVIAVYGTGAASLTGPTVTKAGGAGTIGVSDAAQAAASAVTPAPATSGSSANWVGQTFALRDDRTSITIERPSGDVYGEVVLVSITVRGLPATGGVCAPDATWTKIDQTTAPATAGDPVTTTQAEFWTVRNNTTDESYTFTFTNAANCTGALASAGATAVALSYRGVDPLIPVDKVNSVTGAGTSLAAVDPAGLHAGDQMVYFFGTGSTTLTGTTYPSPGPGGATAASTTKTAGSGTAANWVAEAVALNFRSSISIERPVDTSDADFMLVSVTAAGLPVGTKICPTDSSWTPLDQTRSPAGTITNGTFYSIRGTTADEAYTFTFRTTGACSVDGLTGTPVNALASAVDVRYTGVALAPSPYDVHGITSGTTSSRGTTFTSAGGLSSTNANEEAVYFYGTGSGTLGGVGAGGTVDTGATVSTPNGATPPSSTGYEDQSLGGAHSGAQQTASTTNSTDWIAETVLLVPSGPGCSSKCAYGLEAPAGNSYTSAQLNAIDNGNGVTYYAQGVNAAQAALTGCPVATVIGCQTNVNKGTQRVIIVLSDGDANMDGGENAATPGACAQAVLNAENAEKTQSGATGDGSSTLVFAIAWNASNTAWNGRSGSCMTDTGTGHPTISAICAMHLMVDNPVTDPSLSSVSTTDIATMESRVCGSTTSDPSLHFYSQPSDGDLTQIFTEIGESLTSTRLISNNAT